MPAASLSAAQARRIAIAAQGLGARRPARPGRREVRRSITTIGALQLDAINVVARTQFLVLFSRIGAYDVGHLHALSGPGGELFEYWGHAACLLPMADQPLWRWRMAQDGLFGESPTRQARRRAFREEHTDYIKAVMAEVRERGPLAASQLSDPRRRDGEWWDRRSVGRVVLELMFARGELAAWRNESFERVYDVPERVIREAVLAAPTPAREDAQRALIAVAARATGVATARDLANYFVFSVRETQARARELVDAGELREVAVDGWREQAYLSTAGRAARPAREHATLLSPFDSLIWDRARVERLFGFSYRIEVYTPAHERKHGYFVMPFLLGDALAGRLDLKADRKASALLVRGAYTEPAFAPRAVAESVARELDAMRAWLGLERVDVARRGNLAGALRGAVPR
jgi:uncharacterized protein